jgi:hypothetical protein
MKNLNEEKLQEKELMLDFVDMAKRTEGTYIRIKGVDTWYRIDIRDGHSYSTNISQAFEFNSDNELQEYLKKAKELGLY